MTDLNWCRLRGTGIVMLAMAGLFVSAAAQAEEVTVTIDNFTFKPEVLTIARDHRHFRQPRRHSAFDRG